MPDWQTPGQRMIFRSVFYLHIGGWENHGEPAKTDIVFDLAAREPQRKWLPYLARQSLVDG